LPRLSTAPLAHPLRGHQSVETSIWGPGWACNVIICEITISGYAATPWP